MTTRMTSSETDQGLSAMTEELVLTPALALSEVARLLGIGRSTAHRLVVSGDLRGFRVGTAWRVLRADLEAFVVARRDAAATRYLDAMGPPSGPLSSRP